MFRFSEQKNKEKKFPESLKEEPKKKNVQNENFQYKEWNVVFNY
jgi:hypothetical protein